MAWPNLQHKLKPSEALSVHYHLQFDYLLTKAEIDKWRVGNKFPVSKYKFLIGKVLDLKKTRRERERWSNGKLQIARRAAKILVKIPTVKFVGVTGSLAMLNAKKESDIDLMLIVSPNTLWITRLLTLFTLLLFHFRVRRSGDTNERDKLCLNLWLDESDLIWQERNEFTAHEIAQIIPLVNKQSVYKAFLWKNKWVLDYWPNAVKITRPTGSDPVRSGSKIIERLAFKLQHWYMKRKITNEVISPARAQFHPRKLPDF